MVGSRSSSDVDHEEAEKLRSVAIDSCAVALQASLQHCSKRKKQQHRNDDDEDAAVDAGGSLKFYQTRAQHLLHEYLDKTMETEFVANDAFEHVHCSAETLDTGFHLFKHAPPGLLDKSPGEDGKDMQAWKRKKHRKNGINESSELFQYNLLAASVDGAAVKLGAEKAVSKALSLWVSQQAAEKEAKTLENERIAALKQQRGEQWLPSVAGDLGVLTMTDEASNPPTTSKELALFNQQTYHQEVDLASCKDYVYKKERKTNNESRKKKRKEKQAIAEESTA